MWFLFILYLYNKRTLSISVGCTICLVMVLAIPVANIVIGEY